MHRDAHRHLNLWKTRANRRPLLLRGARQVGKTWLVRHHGKSYDSFLEINLESHPEYQKPFQDHFGKPLELIKALTLLTGTSILPGHTLLFIDEIQESPEALLALRYFKEKLPELHVIAAGSLLEFTFKDVSFPVGRVEFMHLAPMSFDEYLGAIGRKDLQEEIAQLTPKALLSEFVHQLLNQTVQDYALIGGMPEVVKTYVKTRDLNACQEVQQSLVATYRADFNKYATRAQVAHLQKVFSCIPMMLGKKFKYAEVDRETKSRDLSVALNLLECAGLVNRVYHSSSNGSPLRAEADLKKFKAFFVDLGLCHRILGLRLSDLYSKKRELLVNRGGISEQLAAQELIAHMPFNETPELHYWHRESPSSSAEVDFVVAEDGKAVPVEVKSSRGGALKSMLLFMTEKRAKKAYLISEQPFSVSNGVWSIPFYAIKRVTNTPT